jgi:aspartyl-tRNA synthetase
MTKKLLKERFQELAGIKPLSEENFDNISFDDKIATFGDAGTDKRTGQVIGDILQLIKSTGIDPEEVIEAIKMSDNLKNYGLPKMDPDNWGFKNPKTGEYNK